MTLNYREVAFVLNKSSVDIKNKFQELLKIDKVSIKDEIHVDTLSWQFGTPKEMYDDNQEQTKNTYKHSFYGCLYYIILIVVIILIFKNFI